MSYSNYDFCLYWEDLPEEFRAEKIDEVIDKRWNNEEYKYIDSDGNETEEIQTRSLAELQEDQEIRKDVENWISTHFPMYF